METSPPFEWRYAPSLVVTHLRAGFGMPSVILRSCPLLRKEGKRTKKRTEKERNSVWTTEGHRVSMLPFPSSVDGMPNGPKELSFPNRFSFTFVGSQNQSSKKQSLRFAVQLKQFFGSGFAELSILFCICKRRREKP